MISWDQRPDGIVMLTLDDRDQSTNTMNRAYLRAMGATIDRLEAQRDSVRGVIVTSGKDTFLLGMDLKEFTAGTGSAVPAAGRDGPTAAGANGDPRRAMYAAAAEVKAQLRRLETYGRPVVAALNGTALGGGFELALACHRRIAVDRPDAQFGLPEVTLGLLPGGGGVTRVTRMLGLQDALMNVLLQGQRLRPSRARDAGVVDDLVSSPAELVDAAVAWIEANPTAAQPWDRPGYRVPGGRPSDRAMAMLLPVFPANLRKQLKGAHYPAAHHIMCAAVEGAQVDFDTALRIEGRWFADLVGTPIQRNMTQAFFFDLQHLNRGGSRPAAVPRSGPVARVGVVGAGMMGAGIAYACAKRGIDVVVMDVSRQAADKAAERHERIAASDRLEDLAGCPVVIEAVFEDHALKHETYRRLAGILDPGALVASNTSSLPITSLAVASADPARFVGMHFFSPVERMPLVEIIRGEQTGDEALASAYDLVRQIGKTPIVVNDSRGFFTSRVFGTYIMEGLALLAEGVPAPSVEQAALQAGYPVGPLAVLDEVSLSLSVRLRDEARKAGVAGPAHPGEPVIDRMVALGRTGKAAGAGFYDYPADGGRKRLWPGLAAEFGAGADAPPAPPRIPMFDMQQRLLFAEALESVKCLDEGVLTSVPDGNIGSIFGIGFPAWTGGVLQYIDGFPGGLPGFVARARELASAYGDRFTPLPSLVVRADRDAHLRD
jgi:3-hydroxyacyl-CoA dehydrogenase/enoyl-CoA hydratase/3-hydroxybutyryl-CoA epimerase